MGTSQGQGASLPQPWAGCDLSAGSPLREPVFLKHNLGAKQGSPELEGQDLGLEGKGQQMRRNQRLLIKPLPDATRRAARPRLMGPSPDTHCQAGKLRRRVARLGFLPRWSESGGRWQWRRGDHNPLYSLPLLPPQCLPGGQPRDTATFTSRPAAAAAATLCCCIPSISKVSGGPAPAAAT